MSETSTALAREQEQKLESAKQFYLESKDKSDKDLSAKDLYKKTLGECVDNLDKHGDGRHHAATRDVDKHIAKYMRDRGHSKDKTADAIYDHSAKAAEHQGMERARYAEGVAREVYPEKKQEQNQRPERSMYRAEEPKTSKLELQTIQQMQQYLDRGR